MHTGDAVNAQHYKARVTPDRPKETGDLPRQEAWSFDLISWQHSTDAAEGWSDKGQEGQGWWIFSRCIFSTKKIESMMDLPIIVAIQFQMHYFTCTTEKFQFSWINSLIADGSNSVYWGGQHRMPICQVVVWLCIHIEVGVGGLSVHRVPQGTMWSSVYDNVQEGNSVSMVNWVFWWMLRWFRKWSIYSGAWGQIINVSTT